MSLRFYVKSTRSLMNFYTKFSDNCIQFHVKSKCKKIFSNFHTVQSYSLLLFLYSQVDYQCFDFLPRHHNIIRYRKGVAMITNDFHTVCSWVQFKNDVAWKYDLMLSKYLLNLKSNVP